MKNVIHVFGASGSGTTMARLCHSAFVRVATFQRKTLKLFAHLCHSAFVRVATRHNPEKIHAVRPLPQRIRAGCDCGKAMQRTANLLREGR